MRHLLIFITLLHSVVAIGQPVDSREREIVFLSVNVVPMDQERVIENQTVVIRHGKVKAIGKQVPYAKNALVIDAKGKYLMPGLGEMHAHVPPIDDMEPMKDVLLLFASNGITTIRGMLGHPVHLLLRSKIRAGEILGPRFFTTGPSLNGLSVTSPEAGAATVRRQKEAGYDFLKLHPGLTREKFDAIATTARQINIPFAGHVSFGVGVWHAIDAGYSSIDHLDGFIDGLVPGIEMMTEQQAGTFGMFVSQQADTTKIPQLMKALASHHVWVVPTQSLAERWFSPHFTPEMFRQSPEARYMSAETIAQWDNAKNNLVKNENYNTATLDHYISLRRALILACQQNGVGLLLGCDAPQIYNVPGFSTHNELQYLVAAGLTPYEALRTGTVNVATYLKIHDAGVIRQGAVADLILITGNPLKDVRETKNISGVMVNGKWLSPEFISTTLKKLEKN